MKLTWLGHACFKIEQDGYQVVLDPYAEVAGHADVQTEAHKVLCSHQHFDHNAVSGVALLPEKENPFTIRTVSTFHDDQGGALRGENIIHILSAGGVTVAHLGDLGHQLTREQLDEIGQVDGILLPVGGTYTVDAAGAKQVCDAIGPKWVIPMHYRHGDYGFPVLTTAEDFAMQWPSVTWLKSDSLEVNAFTDGVMVLKFGA